MSAPSPSEVAEAGGPHVAPLLGRVEERLAAIAGTHGEPLAGYAGGTIAAGGKRLRPLIVLLAAGPAAEGDPEDLVRAAVAVELVHAATLVHDDVLDRAPLRRGRPTVFATAGRQAAVQTGDMLFAHAFEELVATGNAEAVRILSDAGSALARGELIQREDAWDAAVAAERLELRADLKTARLFGACARLGALLAGEEAVVVDALGEFGRRIGLAFQMLDDVLDVAGPPERTGKHRGTDLLDGTITLPFVLAREREPALAALDPRSVGTPARAEEVCDAIAATGALDDARELALAHVAAAKGGLPASLDERRRAVLRLVADGVVRRYA